MANVESAPAVGGSEAREEPAAAPSLLKNPRIRKVGAGLAVALVALFAVWWVRFRPYVSTDDARVAAPVVTVVAQGAGGRIERVLVREGDVVQAGTPVVELDATAERAQVERAAALLALAESRVGEAEVQVRLEERLSKVSETRADANVRSAKAVEQRTVRGPRSEELAKARADVAAAEAVAAEARRELDRAQGLAREGAIAAAGLESAQTAEASARATLEARKASLSLLENGSRPEDISIAGAGVLQAQSGVVEANAGVDRVALRTRQVEGARAQAAQARAELALAKVALDRMTLKSSVGGMVVRVTVDPGDYVSTGQGAVTIVDVKQAWIAANIEETSSGQLRPGQAVTIAVDEGGELTGHVDVITQSAASQFALIPSDNAAGNFTKVVQRIPIRVAIDPNPRVSSLRVGQSVELRIRVR
ncbi:MAG TPA: efflux RND transporter periplasmic adaptor subunit [Polyangiaceae bacterium]